MFAVLWVPLCHLQEARQVNFAASGAPFKASRASSSAWTFTPLFAVAIVIDGIEGSTDELTTTCEVTGIPPQCTHMDEGEFVRGAHVGHNGFGGQGWGGPHPPAGDEPHRYFFRLYAVDQPLEVDPDAGADRIHAALEGHTLEEATLVGRYGR